MESLSAWTILIGYTKPTRSAFGCGGLFLLVIVVERGE